MSEDLSWETAALQREIWREYQIQRDPLMLSVHETRSTTESFLLIIVWSHRSSHIGTSSKRTSTNQQIMWFQYDMLQGHLVSNWRNPQMKYFYFRFYIYSFGTFLLWSDKFITTSRQKCQRISLEKPQLCKGCRFVGVAPRKRSVIWREYQI